VHFEEDTMAKMSVLVWVEGGLVQDVQIADTDGRVYDWADGNAPVNVVVADFDAFDSTDDAEVDEYRAHLRSEAETLPEPLRSGLLKAIPQGN
jgi:hypothetical protein